VKFVIIITRVANSEFREYYGDNFHSSDYGSKSCSFSFRLSCSNDQLFNFKMESNGIKQSDQIIS